MFNAQLVARNKTGSQTNLWEPARYHLVAAYTKITQSLIGAYRERSMLKQTRIDLGGWLIVVDAAEESFWGLPSFTALRCCLLHP